MIRVNLFLLALLIVSALGTVAAQHKSRRLFAELDREQVAQRTLEIEYRQLQLEQSTWAMHSRIEKIALAQLNMQMPAPSRVQVVARGAVPADRSAPTAPTAARDSAGASR